MATQSVTNAPDLEAVSYDVSIIVATNGLGNSARFSSHVQRVFSDQIEAGAMVDPQYFLITLSRAVDVLRAEPDAIDKHKAALRALVALTGLGEVLVLRSAGKQFVVSDIPILLILPELTKLGEQFDRLEVTEVAISEKPAAADLLKLIRFLAAEPPGTEELPNPDSVKLVRKVSEIKPPEQVEEAQDEIVRKDVLLPEIEPKAAAPKGTPLDLALARFQRDPFGQQVLNELTKLSSLIQNELDSDHVEQVVPVTSVMVDLEAGAPNESVRRAYSIALKRLLTRQNVERFADTLLDSRYATYAAMVVVRSGHVGLEILGERLNQPGGAREAIIYLSAITHFPDSEKTLLSLLTHQYWHVVEGAVKLLGSLRCTEAINELEPLLKHEHAKVRAATVAALGDMGDPAALAVLRKAIGSGEADLQITVAGGVKGRASGALAMPLVMAAEEEKVSPRVRRECYLGLGRIGTPDAVQALKKAAEPGGRLIGRKSTAQRVAAVEGLYFAGGSAAVDTLKALAKDKDKAVRQAAGKALERLEKE